MPAPVPLPKNDVCPLGEKCKGISWLTLLSSLAMTGLEGKPRDLGTTGSKPSLFGTAQLSKQGFAAALLWLALERA